MSLAPQPSAANLSGIDAAAALAALALLVDAGVDTLVSDTPATWLAPVAALPEPVAAPAPAAAARPAPKPADNGALLARLAGCDTLAALSALVVEQGGRAALFGDGNPAARVMVVGDMPSADDSAAGRLFSGPAGQLLDRMLAAIGRDRADTYLVNLLAVPTAGGRAPDAAAIAAALPLVRRHIALVRPHAVLLLGGVTAAALLGVESGIARLRGKWQTLTIDDQAIPALPSFAPAYLLAQPAHKALAWHDLQLFRSALAAHAAAS